MIGDTAMTGAAQSASAARTPGTARIGSMLMNGLDGQITTASVAGSANAARKSGCARAVAAPWNASSCTAGSQRRRTKYSWKSIQPSSVRTRVRTGSSLIGSTRGPTPSRVHKSAVIADSVSPARSRRVRSTCTARSRSPRRNQVSPPSVAERLHERPGLVAAAPAELPVGHARQRVHHRVDIGRYPQAEMLEIVAGIGRRPAVPRPAKHG